MPKQLLAFKRQYVGNGNLRKCGMQKVICGTKSAEWRWLVDGRDHVISPIPQITTYLPSLTWW